MQTQNIRTIGEHALTSEMNVIVDRVLDDKSVKGFAFAGSGKSTLLRAIEKYHINKKGLYICYNKSLEMEARKLFKGQSVEIATSHSFALNHFDKSVSESFISKTQIKLNQSLFCQYTGHIEPDNELRTKLDINRHWRVVQSICDQFICTASLELSQIHINKKVVQFLKKQISESTIDKEEVDQAKTLLVKMAQSLASQMLDADSPCPATHDTYIKAWQLDSPALNYDYIMFDEAQDANPVLLNVIINQDCQQIFVGDKYQSIYQFRGGVNAMDIIPFEAYPLSCSFRYGKEIAKLATDVLSKMDSSVKVTGLGEPTDIICGTHADDDQQVMCICYRNDSLLELLIKNHEEDRPAILTNGKTEWLRDILQSLLHFKSNNKKASTFSRHERYKSYDELILGEKDGNTQSLVHYIEETELAESLLNALNWSLEQREPIVLLTTAHMCKGLEADNVYLHHDFHPIIKAYSHGKPVEDTDLNLFYVAMTRAKKKLYLSKPLNDALEANLAFSIRPYKPEPCLLDNLLPKKLTAPVHLSVKDSHAVLAEIKDTIHPMVIIDDKSLFAGQPEIEFNDNSVTLSPIGYLSMTLEGLNLTTLDKVTFISECVAQAYTLSNGEHSTLKNIMQRCVTKHANNHVLFEPIQKELKAHQVNRSALTFAVDELARFEPFSNPQAINNDKALMVIDLSYTTNPIKGIVALISMKWLVKHTKVAQLVDTAFTLSIIEPSIKDALKKNKNFKIKYTASTTQDIEQVKQGIKTQLSEELDELSYWVGEN